jgi:cell division protein FtsW (lipid II flippase)
MILYLAEFLTSHDRELSFAKTWTQPFIVSIIAIGTVLGGKDLGTAMVMVAILVGVLTFAGMPRVWFWRITAFLAAGIWIALQQGGSRMGRIMAWLHPDWPDPNQYNWQQDHAMWAFASGGWTGVGLGKSQLKWSWIPEAENDFIFAIIGEEGGLLFSIFIVGLFVWLTYALLFTAENNSDTFSRYLIQGVLIWIAVQSTINIAVVLDWLPVLGVPLPLISAGGYSLVMLLAAFGLVLGAERQYGSSSQRRLR